MENDTTLPEHMTTQDGHNYVDNINEVADAVESYMESIMDHEREGITRYSDAEDQHGRLMELSRMINSMLHSRGLST